MPGGRHQGVSPSVSYSVSSIIEAFNSCRQIFGRACEHSSAKSKPRRKEHREREIRLGDSLKRGPAEIETEYARGASLGPRFTTGDVEAQAILTKTLLNLNNGLVNIIAAFLSNANLNNVRLDYSALTALSDSSRADARDGLARLRQRVAQSQQIRSLPPNCTKCGGLVHQHPHPAPRKALPRPPSESQKVSKLTGGKIALVTAKNSNQKQLALVRQRHVKMRTPSSSSASSASSQSSLGSSHTSGASTDITSSCSRCSACHTDNNQTVCLLSSQDHRNSARATKATNESTRKQIHKPKQNKQGAQVMPPDSIHLRISVQPPEPYTHQALVLGTCSQAHPPTPQELEAVEPRDRSVARRRQNKVVESVYSFKSDSTKLGEIPLHKWSEPFDWAEMERLNAEAEIAGWAATLPGRQDGKTRSSDRRGVFAKMFKKAPMKTISEG